MFRCLAKGSCFLGANCVAPFALLPRVIYKRKKCRSQPHPAVFNGRSTATEGGMPDQFSVCHFSSCHNPIQLSFIEGFQQLKMECQINSKSYSIVVDSSLSSITSKLKKFFIDPNCHHTAHESKVLLRSMTLISVFFLIYFGQGEYLFSKEIECSKYEETGIYLTAS